MGLPGRVSRLLDAFRARFLHVRIVALRNVYIATKSPVVRHSPSQRTLLLSASESNIYRGRLRGLRWSFPGTDRALFRSFRWRLASPTRSHFHLKCRPHKGGRDAARVAGVGFSAELAGGGGPPEMKARRHFPVICIRNERTDGRAYCVAVQFAVIARRVPRYSTRRRLVALATDYRATTNEP